MSGSSSAPDRSPFAAVCHAISARRCNSASVEACASDQSASTSDSSRTAIHCRPSGPSRWPRRFRSIEGRPMKALAAALLVFVAACGQGKAIVDSVRITSGNANLINSAGTGTIGLQFRFAADSAGTNTAPAALSIAPTTVTGAQTVPVAISGDLSSTINALFTRDTLWMRITATGTNPGLTPVTGKGAITALVIRVVLEDKIF